mmetsp:Transcript_27732/g.73214  ORF Transcript_27732/g.73214 Transcript_27732/m.73214 type:complete len:246 (+) Transcript_27732:549-1286(+)
MVDQVETIHQPQVQGVNSHCLEAQKEDISERCPRHNVIAIDKAIDFQGRQRRRCLGIKHGWRRVGPTRELRLAFQRGRAKQQGANDCASCSKTVPSYNDLPPLVLRELLLKYWPYLFQDFSGTVQNAFVRLDALDLGNVNTFAHSIGDGVRLTGRPPNREHDALFPEVDGYHVPGAENRPDRKVCQFNLRPALQRFDDHRLVHQLLVLTSHVVNNLTIRRTGEVDPVVRLHKERQLLHLLLGVGM